SQAGNLLVNPSFEQNSGHAIPVGWTRFAPPNAQPAGNYWVENNPPVPHTGTLYWKEWGASYLSPPTNNVAGIYQDYGAAPGNTYQASGWFYVNPNDAMGADCYTWIQVEFLGASSNLLALYKSSNFTTSVGTSNWFQYTVTSACDPTMPVSTGDPYFTTYAVTGTVSQLVAPPATAKVRYRYAYLQSGSEGGSSYFDDAVLNQTSGSIPPVFANLFPLNMIFVNPADGLSFNVSSPDLATINSSAIQVVLNGSNISSGLTITGTSSNKNVSYTGLKSNTVYNASFSVTDSSNLTSTASTYFETTWVGVPPILYLWEAEDFDFNSGMYINNPDLCNTNGNTNCYFGKVGTEGTDEHNTDLGALHLYRAADAMPTAVAG